MGDLVSSKYIIKMTFTTFVLYSLGIFFQFLETVFEKWPTIYMTSNLDYSIFEYEVWRIFIYFLFEPSRTVFIIILIHLQLFLPRFVIFLILLL